MNKELTKKYDKLESAIMLKDENLIKQAVKDFQVTFESVSNQTQIGGTHYQEKSIQPWDYIIANNIGYLEGNVIKYVSRWKQKGGVEDLKKARHYLDKLIEFAQSGG